jgi:hypothetical protein
LLVRAIRQHALQSNTDKKTLVEILKSVALDFRPSAHTSALEMMDLLAAKECTDQRFLPERFSSFTAEDVQKRIEALHVK